ncbi:MAG: acyltransferase [Nitrospina sp.]|nr:acyltransferase [Nitrospina sp.]
MNEEVDKASYRNRGSWGQGLITAYKIWRYINEAGEGNVIKWNTEFHLTEGARIYLGNNVTLQNYSYFQLTKPHPSLYIGDNTVVGRHTMVTAKNSIKIGSNVLIGAYVQIIDHNHGIRKHAVIREQTAEIGEVLIEDDVWVGAGAKVLNNSKVGRGAVVGANAVVTGDIPPFAIAVGAPAKVIKYRS